jgi:AraC-like DNA-binding protein
MIENFNLDLLAGGLYQHTSAWNKLGNFTQCYKLYLPVRGQAVVETAGGRRMMKPGHFYFVSGYHLREQTCRSMTAYWIHFTCESFYLHHRIGQELSVRQWPADRLRWASAAFRRIEEIFQYPETRHSSPRRAPPLDLLCRFEAVLMYFVADLLELQHRSISESALDLHRLKPAIDYMDDHFLHNPSLEEVAQQAGLAPNYFHRLFRKAAGATPFTYMERRRLDRARRLLFSDRITVKEAAARCGYENQLYFSRVFRRRFGLAPSDLSRNPTLLS